MSSQSLENMLGCSSKAQQERKPRPQPEHALNCPRCDSTNTKFCYYNNYSLSQPRYFCKSCRRYWTKGGTLRNIPVGGGCRKNKRSSSSTTSSKRVQDQTFTPNHNPLTTTLPHLSYDSNDFTIALARLQKQSSGQMGYNNDHNLSILGNPTSFFSDALGNSSLNLSSSNPGILEAIRSGFLGIQNMYGVYGNGETGEVDNGSGVSGEMMVPNYEQEIMSNGTTQSMSVTSMMKQEKEQSFPWHLNNGDTNMMSEVDSGRASWNSGFTSWHGLLHSPLM
ncbi:hypothetical protein RJT34_28528 [Clitoria ternatea]|uniref:Dof zinc finger protein n=1 Tax=Clitoria ternatea TaxID=43366 RepID=A0AAN9FB06_CLITE